MIQKVLSVGTLLCALQSDKPLMCGVPVQDVLKFGNSTREYVLLHEGSLDN